MGVVDASLTTQLDALRAAMSRAVKRAVAES
jgi:type III secretion protein L